MPNGFAEKDRAMKPKTVLQIVTDHLTANGYHGLVAEDRECACELGDLAPCESLGESCEAGWFDLRRCPNDSEDSAVFLITTNPDDALSPEQAAEFLAGRGK
jgi:hypothetical protein